jgi:hypothetical protein
MQPDEIALWEFPADDFAAWRDLVGSPQVASHAEYMAMLAAVQADQERQGRAVRRVRMTVAAMRVALAEAGLENTPNHRAAIIGSA